MIAANQYKTAQVKQLISQYPKLKEHSKIRETNKGCYVIACITNKTEQNGVQTSRVDVSSITLDSWMRMRDTSNKAFNCHIVVILHDPTRVPVKAEKKPVEETPTEDK